MARTKSGLFTNDTGASGITQDITGLGFQPSGVVIWMINDNTTNATAWAQGASDFTNHVASGIVGTSPGNSARVGATNRVIYRPATSGALQVEATASVLADGFRLTYQTAANGLRWGYIAFKNNVSFKVGTLTPTSTGAGSVSTVGFKPGTMMTFWLPGSASRASWGHGMVDGALNQYALSGNNDTGSGSYTTVRNSDAFAVASVNSGDYTYGSVTGYTSSGFDYNFGLVGGGGGQTFGYVCIGEEIKSVMQTPSISSDPGTHTGFGINPEALLVTAKPPATTYGVVASMGVTASGAQFTTATSGYNGGSVTNRASDEAKGIGRTEFSSTVLGLADAGTVTLTTGGFTTAGIADVSVAYYALAMAENYTTIPLNQTGDARIERVASLVQSGQSSITRIDSLTQQGNARIERVSNVTQSGNARIQRTEQQTQQGNANITRINSIGQTGNATIELFYFEASIEQPGNATIEKVISLTQPGDARIERVENIQQTGNAAIARQDSIDQQGNARIEKIRTITQVGRAVIIRVDQLDQTGNARIVRQEQLQQLGNASISNPSPDKRPQEWIDSDEEMPATWTEEDQLQQEWDAADDRAENTWQDTDDPLDQQWSDSSNTQPTEWRRQFYD